jgi:hypothetical protein
MYKTAAYIASVEVFGLLGFIIASRYHEGMLVRFLPILIALVAIIYISYFKAVMILHKEIVYISILASAIFIFVVQILGYTIYPGLNKDIDFFSGTNALRTVLMLSIGFSGHFLLLALVNIVRKTNRE